MIHSHALGSRFERLQPPARLALAVLVSLVAPLASVILSPGALRAQGTGSFLAMQIDKSPLPLADRVTDADGTTYLVEFDRLILSLRSGNRFRASVRYRRTLTTADEGQRSRSAPIQSLTVSGSYVVSGTEIRFTPDPGGDARGLRMLAGKVDGTERISVPFDYRNGAVQRRRVLELERRDDIL